MGTWWRKLGRPALLGFAVGIVVVTGLAWFAPLAGVGAPSSEPRR